MRTTAEIIDALAGDLSPAPRAFVAKRIAGGLGAGAALSCLVTLALWGPRPDFANAILTWPFWMKAGFTGSLAIGGIAAIARLARPGAQAYGSALVILLAVTVMSGLAVLQFALAPAASHRRLVMGSTAASCPWLIMLLAIPIFLGALWAMRAMAPTRLTLAGAATGLVAGSLAAFVYAVSCDEGAAPFVLIWYGLGIAVPTLLGALLGRVLLRW